MCTVIEFLLVAFCVLSCQQEPARLTPRYLAVLSEDRVASRLTATVVEGELHVLFANRDTLTLQLARLDPRLNQHTLETVDAVGIYPGDLSAFGVHAYAVHAGRQHVIYVDQQQADALIPKWIQRDAGEELWWVTTPHFDGTPLALLPQPSGDLLLVAATPDGAAVTALSSVSGLGRHRLEQMPEQPRAVWPVPCLQDAAFVALMTPDTLSLYGEGGVPEPMASEVGAHYAACANGIARLLWHVPSTGEVLFAKLTADGLGATTAVTLARGTTTVYFLPHRDGFAFVINELTAYANDDSIVPDGRHRIVLIYPDRAQRQPSGYRKSVLVANALPSGFSAAHLAELLIIVEHRTGDRHDTGAGLRAAIFPLP